MYTIYSISQASEVLLFNKKLTAKEAFERNLVTEVIPHGSFAEETEAKIKLYASFPPQVNTSLAIYFFFFLFYLVEILLMDLYQVNVLNQ